MGIPIFKIMQELLEDESLHISLEQTRVFDMTNDGRIHKRDWFKRHWVLSFNEVDEDLRIMQTPLILDLDYVDEHYDNGKYVRVFNKEKMQKLFPECLELVFKYEPEPFVIFTRNGARIISRYYFTWGQVAQIFDEIYAANVGIEDCSYAFIAQKPIIYPNGDILTINTTKKFHRNLPVRVSNKYDEIDMWISSNTPIKEKNEAKHILLIVGLIEAFGSLKK